MVTLTAGLDLAEVKQGPDAIHALLTAAPCTPDLEIAAGLVDEVATAEELEAATVAKAAAPGAAWRL